MKVVAIIQARMGSTRLAGKSLLDIAGQPLLGHIIDRVRASRDVQEIVVATTTAAEDQELVELARRKSVASYRGSADDVLDRFYQAAKLLQAEIVVRITADDPFKDPDVIDLIIGHLLANPVLDYVSNTITPTYPEGLDVEAFRHGALSRAWREARLTSEREHVTPYIWKHPDSFTLFNVCHTVDISKMRWTLDYEEDLQFAREIYARLYRGGIFKMNDILRLLEAEPNLGAINAGIQRNAGYLKSLEAECHPPKS